MRILVVPTTDWLGHPVLERQHHIFDSMALRHDIHVLRFRYYNNKTLHTEAIVHEMSDRTTSSLATYYLVNAIQHKKAIQEIVRGNRIELVVLSNLLPAFTSCGWLRKRTLTVFDLSDHFPTSAAGYFFDVRSRLGRLTSKALEIMLQRTIRNVNHTVACSFPLMNYAKRLGAKKVSVIPNGVDKVFFAKEYDGFKIRHLYNLDGNIIIGFVGMIEFWLSMRPLFEAIKELKKTYKIKLFIVGKKFQTRTQNEVQHEINELDIHENVVWSNGFVPYYKLPDYIAAMDLCVIPFNHTHPTAYFSSPNKLWEYLALGKPVLTTPLPDVLIQAGRFVNIVVTSQDYVKVIEDYIINPEKYRQKIKGSQQLLSDRTWLRMSETYEQLLTGL